MKLIKYLGMLGLQFAGIVALTYALFNLIWLSGMVYLVCVWTIWPAVGLISAYLVTVRGVNNYLAWFAPPLGGLAAHYLAFFYMPESAGPFLICALCSIVGAAAGDVKKKLQRK